MEFYEHVLSAGVIAAVYLLLGPFVEDDVSKAKTYAFCLGYVPQKINIYIFFHVADIFLMCWRVRSCGSVHWFLKTWSLCETDCVYCVASAPPLVARRAIATNRRVCLSFIRGNLIFVFVSYPRPRQPPPPPYCPPPRLLARAQHKMPRHLSAREKSSRELYVALSNLSYRRGTVHSTFRSVAAGKGHQNNISACRNICPRP